MLYELNTTYYVVGFTPNFTCKLSICFVIFRISIERKSLFSEDFFSESESFPEVTGAFTVDVTVAVEVASVLVFESFSDVGRFFFLYSVNNL